MARTVTEIKASMTTQFMASTTLSERYGFTVGASFDDTFSKVSIESIKYYIIAVAHFTLESIFDALKVYVNTVLASLKPHTERWYRDKVLGFMLDMTLVQDEDYYDTSAMSDSEIVAAKVVKYAAAKEATDSSFLTIKIAGETGGVRSKLSDEVAIQVAAYIQEFKDIGVKINLVNQDADIFNCELDIYYDPILLPDTVKNSVSAALTSYIQNLTFNGEYTNQSLVDALQKLDGVRIAELKWAKSRDVNSTIFDLINAKKTPISGYFTPGVININMIADVSI